LFKKRAVSKIRAKIRPARFKAFTGINFFNPNNISATESGVKIPKNEEVTLENYFDQMERKYNIREKQSRSNGRCRATTSGPIARHNYIRERSNYRGADCVQAVSKLKPLRFIKQEQQYSKEVEEIMMHQQMYQQRPDSRYNPNTIHTSLNNLKECNKELNIRNTIKNLIAKKG